MAVEKCRIFEDSELEALLSEYLCQTQEELVKSLGVNQQAISNLKAVGMVQKRGNLIPYELKSRDIHIAACQRLVQCCKTGENLLGNAEIEGLTPPTVLSRRCSF